MPKTIKADQKKPLYYFHCPHVY